MRKNLVMVMDDIAAINIVKDTSFAMLLSAQRRGYRLCYVNDTGLWLDGATAGADMRELTVRDDAAGWFELGAADSRPLGGDDLVMMRSDPPVDSAYLYATHVLEQAGVQGAKVVNNPRALRDFNEKLAIVRFGEWMPATLVSSSHARLRAFVGRHRQAVLKPLDGMGGKSVFVTRGDDPNLNVIMETLTDSGRQLIMAQEYLPAIGEGDKRLLLVHGKPVDYLLARIPGGQDFRGNLARGGRGEGRELAASDRAIAEAVGPVLLEHGIEFAGLDVIGDRLTEVNVTSPTCVRELDREFSLDIARDLLNAVDP